MQFDLRTPIGLLFIAYGAILAIYGLLSPEAIYARSLGININLIWGLVMLVFGGIMLALALVSRRKGTN
jgi:uncharacterized membrane protein YeiB